MRLTDMFLALPLLPLLLVVIMLFRDSLRAAFGPETGIFLLWWSSSSASPAGCRPRASCAGDVLALREREFVTAARSIGTRKRPHHHPPQSCPTC